MKLNKTKGEFSIARHQAIEKTSVRRVQKRRALVGGTYFSILHRYGPEDRPPALPRVSLRVCEQISTAPEGKPMAFCPTCNCDVLMKWKARKKRGKSVNDWFVCAKCNCDRLEIKILEKENK